MQWIRFLLWPFGLIYGSLTSLRNALYNSGILSVYKPPGPVVCVGNLSTGGTGKTPHVIHLATHLGKTERVGILSRGYGRKSSGFRWVKPSDSWAQVGDEPLEMALRVPKAVIAVCEDRVEGLKRLFQEGRVDVVIMDDGFQHRRVKPGFQILLTSHHRPFFHDFILPVGNLREWASGFRRADFLLITKTPPQGEKLRLPDRVNLPYAYSTNRYTDPVCMYAGRRDHASNRTDAKAEAAPDRDTLDALKASGAVAVSAIADPSKFIAALQPELRILASLSWRDHHPFNASDVEKIKAAAQQYGAPVITTLKDYVRLREIWEKEDGGDLWVLPQAVEPLTESFYNELQNYVTRTKRS